MDARDGTKACLYMVLRKKEPERMLIVKLGTDGGLFEER